MSPTPIGRHARGRAFLLGSDARAVTVDVDQIDRGLWRLCATATDLSTITSYVIEGDDGCLLVDPGSSVTWAEMLGALAHIRADLDIKWIAGHSALPSSLGALPLIEATLGDDITVVTSAELAPVISHYGTTLPLQVLNPGESVELGGRSVVAEASHHGTARFLLRDPLTGRVFGAAGDDKPHAKLPQRLETARAALENVLLTTLAPIALEGRALAALAPVGRVTSLRTYVCQGELWWELGGRGGLLGSAIDVPPPPGPTTLRVELSEPMPVILDLRFASESAEVLQDPALPDLLESLQPALVSAMRRVLVLREQVMMTRRLRSDLRRDPLTGVGNRRAMQDWSCRGEYAVLMVDLDWFKDVNDNAGHNTGDRLLRAVADTIARQIRGKDMLVRYGGDEFVVLLDGANLIVAKLVAERIRDAVESLDTESLGLPGSISVSVGVAGGEGPLEDRLAEADHALYRAKADGRNVVRGGE